MKWTYGTLCVLGVVLPYSQLVPWLMTHGLDVRAMIYEAAQLRIGAFAWLDVVVSGVVLLTFMASEQRRVAVRHWWAPIVGTLLAGVSLGLPLYLLIRELHLERPTDP